ncbi:hypothetical protein P7H22_26680 [Paenibacillus larvae]|nr:hypothetical protein [Paenibacillus larvae]MDT2243191.1 hypothetical protein [Paenibacillus larvae]
MTNKCSASGGLFEIFGIEDSDAQAIVSKITSVFDHSGNDLETLKNIMPDVTSVSSMER